MKEQMKSKIKIILVLFIALAFIATLPAIFQNASRTRQVKNEVKQILDTAKVICKSGCTSYPEDWIIRDKQNEAELYCMRQCQNNMKGIRGSLLNEDFPVLFTSQYNFRVAQIYCLLGLRCSQLEIIDFIESY